MPIPVEVISYGAAVITALVGWYIAESVRAKNRADAAKSITEAATNLVDQKDEELKELKHENKIKDMYIAYLLDGVRKLHLQIDDDSIFIPISLSEFEDKVK